MKKLLSTLALCSYIITGTNVSLASENDESAVNIVETVNTIWNNTFNSGDSDALSQLYTENAILSPGNGKSLVGQEQIGHLFKTFIDNGVHNHSIKIIEAYRDHNQIVQLARWQAESVNDKQEPISFGGVLMTVIEKNSDGIWLTRSHIWNMGN